MRLLLIIALLFVVSCDDKPPPLPPPPIPEPTTQVIFPAIYVVDVEWATSDGSRFVEQFNADRAEGSVLYLKSANGAGHIEGYTDGIFEFRFTALGKPLEAYGGVQVEDGKAILKQRGFEHFTPNSTITEVKIIHR